MRRTGGRRLRDWGPAPLYSLIHYPACLIVQPDPTRQVGDLPHGAGVIMRADVDAFAETATQGRAEADPDTGTRPDGDGPSIEPPGIEGYDHAGDRREPRSGRDCRRYRVVDARS